MVQCRMSFPERPVSAEPCQPCINVSLPKFVTATECRVQNPKKPRRTHSKTSHVPSLPFVFLTMRFEDALKSPKIDDQIFGKFGFILICQTVTETDPQGTSGLICSSEMSIIGVCIVSQFYFTSSLDLPHPLSGAPPRIP